MPAAKGKIAFPQMLAIHIDTIFQAALTPMRSGNGGRNVHFPEKHEKCGKIHIAIYYFLMAPQMQVAVTQKSVKNTQRKTSLAKKSYMTYHSAFVPCRAVHSSKLDTLCCCATNNMLRCTSVTAAYTLYIQDRLHWSPNWST